jgi:hypothetical protein
LVQSVGRARVLRIVVRAKTPHIRENSPPYRYFSVILPLRKEVRDKKEK